MSDMDIFTKYTFPDQWRSDLAASSPKWLVLDANWRADSIREWINIGKAHGAKIAFEPVSIQKSKRLFPIERGMGKLGIFPSASVDLASPNTYELAALYGEAKENGYLDSHDWFGVIDAFGMRGAREQFVRLSSRELTDAGVPVQCVNLLPYIPNLVAKLGENGVLLAILLGRDDPRLRHAEAEKYILARAPADHPTIGGIYMRLFPPAEVVNDTVSVNGVGDTFLGVLVSGLSQGGKIEDLINVAQKGAVLTLKSAESVSSQLMDLEGELSRSISNK